MTPADTIITKVFTVSDHEYEILSSNIESLSPFSLQATPTYPPTHPEVFAVVLSLESLSPLQARLRTEAEVAIVEPRGVIRLTYSSYSGVEGQEVHVGVAGHNVLTLLFIFYLFFLFIFYCLIVSSLFSPPFQAIISITRFYGSQGDIIVNGEAKTVSADSIPANQIAAVATSDFLQSPMSIIISDGESYGSIVFPLPQNSEITPLKVFNFILTSVDIFPVDASYSGNSYTQRTIA